MSLMLAHKRSVQGARKTGVPTVFTTMQRSTAPKSMLATQQHEALLRASLQTDLDALSNVAAVERKITIKRESLLPKYAGYVERLREAGTPHELIGYYLVWLFDCERIEQALDLTDWCCAHGQGLPERFSTPLQAFVARQVIDWAEQVFKAGQSPEPFFDHVYTRIFNREPPWDVHTDVSAKALRLRGLMLERDGDLAGAVAVFEKALSYGAQVKTVLANIKKRLSA